MPKINRILWVSGLHADCTQGLALHRRPSVLLGDTRRPGRARRSLGADYGAARREEVRPEGGRELALELVAGRSMNHGQLLVSHLANQCVSMCFNGYMCHG